MQPGSVKRGVIAADDSIIIRDNVRGALGGPWQVFLAVDGAEAIEYARRLTAQLVLLDLRMPRVDGIAACACIRNLPGYADVPIMLLTAYDSPELRRRAKSAGATDIFAKPFTAAALQQRAAALMASFQPGVARAGPAMPPLGLAETDSPLDALAAGREVLAVHRQVEEAARQRPNISFAEIMAAWRAQARR
jgi:CheY-like chemotaxis protein